MKNKFFTLAALLFVSVSFAQNSDFKNDAIKVIQLAGSTAQMEMVKKQILPNIPADKHAMFNLEFDGQLANFTNKIAEIYMQEYTHDDLKEMLKFYNSPIGKKIQNKTPLLIEKSAEAGAAWGQELQPMLMKYMQ